MTDPDSTTIVTYPSPGAIEAKLNERKRPVNPNGGEQPQVDTSSPPPQHGGIDRTVADYEDDGSTAVVGGTVTPKISIAPIDHVRDWEPFLTDTNPTTGGGIVENTGGSWP